MFLLYIYYAKGNMALPYKYISETFLYIYIVILNNNMQIIIKELKMDVNELVSIYGFKTSFIEYLHFYKNHN